MLIWAEFVEAALVSDPYLVAYIPDLFNPTKARVYPRSLPAEAEYPSLVYTWLGTENDAQSEGGFRQLATSHWGLACVNSGIALTELQANVYARCDQILQGGAGSFQHGRVVSCLRASDWSPPISPDSGVQYNRIGGRYRVQIDSLALGVPTYVVLGGSSYTLQTEVFSGPATTVHVSLPVRLLLSVTRNGQVRYAGNGYTEVGQDFTPDPPLADSFDRLGIQYYG